MPNTVWGSGYKGYKGQEFCQQCQRMNNGLTVTWAKDNLWCSAPNGPENTPEDVHVVSGKSCSCLHATQCFLKGLAKTA